MTFDPPDEDSIEVVPEAETQPINPLGLTPSVAVIRAELLLALKPFISTEETRYYLNGVYIEANPAGRGVIAVATDGTTMAAVFDPEGFVAGLPHIWKVSDFEKEMKSALTKKVRKFGGHHVVWAHLQHDGSNTRNNQVSAFEADPADLFERPEEVTEQASRSFIMPADYAIAGSFPEWRRVVPRRTYLADIEVDKGWISAKYVTRLAAFGNALNKAAGSRDAPPMRLLAADHQDGPWIARYGSISHAFAVVMPIRASGDDVWEHGKIIRGAPEWVHFTEPPPPPPEEIPAEAKQAEALDPA